MNKVANGEGIAPEQMMILMLKAQTNHFAHLDVELRNEMITLREDMDKRFEQVDKRFEQVDKRFEQVDKRFEQVDKRFEQLTSRIDHFMIWSFATTVSVGGMIVAAIKFL
jgi:archaellum component FlaC